MAGSSNSTRSPPPPSPPAKPVVPEDEMNLTTKQPNPKEVMTKLLGSTLKCTLSDGRTVTGKFLCLDRLQNIVMSDVKEVRRIPTTTVNVTDGRTKGSQKDEQEGKEREREEEWVTRELSQAMVPGKHLIKVEVDESTWKEKVLVPVPVVAATADVTTTSTTTKEEE